MYSFSLRTCLCYKRISFSADLCFHGREDFCIPTPPIMKLKSILSRKISYFISFSARKMCWTKRSGLHGKSEHFPLYHKILSSQKSTFDEILYGHGQNKNMKNNCLTWKLIKPLHTHFRLEFTELIKNFKEDARSIEGFCSIPITAKKCVLQMKS